VLSACALLKAAAATAAVAALQVIVDVDSASIVNRRRQQQQHAQKKQNVETMESALQRLSTSVSHDATALADNFGAWVLAFCPTLNMGALTGLQHRSTCGVMAVPAWSLRMGTKRARTTRTVHSLCSSRHVVAGLWYVMFVFAAVVIYVVGPRSHLLILWHRASARNTTRPPLMVADRAPI
jgi:hypothetical protein